MPVGTTAGKGTRQRQSGEAARKAIGETIAACRVRHEGVTNLSLIVRRLVVGRVLVAHSSVPGRVLVVSGLKEHWEVSRVSIRSAVRRRAGLPAFSKIVNFPAVAINGRIRGRVDGNGPRSVRRLRRRSGLAFIGEGREGKDGTRFKAAVSFRAISLTVLVLKPT